MPSVRFVNVHVKTPIPFEERHHGKDPSRFRISILVRDFVYVAKGSNIVTGEEGVWPLPCR